MRSLERTATLEARVIPTLLIVGVVLGVLVHDTRSLKRSTALTAAVAVAWGLLVGMDAGPGVAVGGTALGLGNLAVGAIAGWAGHGVARAVRSTTASGLDR